MMTITIAASPVSRLKSSATGHVGSKSALALLMLVVCGAAVASLLATGDHAKAQALANVGDDLARLLRAMAAIKAMMAGVAALAIGWRLRSPIRLSWLTGYLAACAAMTVGLGLIWNLAQVGLGALMLHAGLLAAVLLIWRDPEVAIRMAALVAARRATITTRVR